MARFLEVLNFKRNKKNDEKNPAVCIIIALCKQLFNNHFYSIKFVRMYFHNISPFWKTLINDRVVEGMNIF